MDDVDGGMSSASAEFSVANDDQVSMVEAATPTVGASFAERVWFALQLERIGFVKAARNYRAGLAASSPHKFHPAAQSDVGGDCASMKCKH